MAQILTLAAEAAEHGEGINPWVVGGLTLALLLVLLGAVVAIGGGREHS